MARADEAAMAALGHVGGARFSGVSTIEAQAATGVMIARASRHEASKPRPRTNGYFTRFHEYRYQLYDAPREQPRGSWFGRSARVRG